MGPFGWITTAVLSENVNLSKRQVLCKKKRLAVYAGETMQLLDGFVFFLSLIYVGLLRKNAKNDNYLVKFGCVNG